MPILNTLKQHKILLDTHVFIWAMLGTKSLKKEFVSFFEKALVSTGVLISPMTIWEIGMLVEKKRIEVELDVLDWVDQVLEIPGFKICPITPHIAIQSTRLPGKLHGDPVDRLLIASAHENNAVLITCDEKIIDYGKEKWVSVYNPS